LIENVDQRSKDYSDIRDKFRPGHADYTYDAKYGVRDYRGGGGKARARPPPVWRLAPSRAKFSTGSTAKVTIRGALVQMGTQKIAAPTGPGTR
jgi:chorismate synthase